MPLSLDDTDVASRVAGGMGGGLAGGGFDLQGASTLYWKPVPLLLRQADREEQQEELTFRILTGVSKSNHSMRVLRIHISSEQDLFFMHSLEVSEEDFQSLKNEQGILVDFASFPMKIITLLDKCTTVQPADAPRFQAVLTVKGGESVFRIVETNDFKQLPHITLAFRPGNDAAVKQFLAFRLLEVKTDVEELRCQLASSQAGHSSASSELAGVRQQLSMVQEQYDKHLLEVQAEAKTQRAHAHEERAKERAEMKEQHDREVADLTRRHAEALEALSSRVHQLDSENRKLRDAKYELDTKVSELSARLGSAEGANRSLEEEVGRLRTQATQLGGDKAAKEVLANELRTKLSAAEEKASAQAEMVEAQRARVRDLEAGMRQVEGRCGELKEALAATEVRLRDTQAEVAKGNNIIDKLAADLRGSKEKGKRKQAILVRQEEELGARDTALAAATREQQQLQANLEALKAEVSSLRQEKGELRGKLDDSKQQLQSNEQMIRWLNQQVTEAQLGTAAGSMLPSSRYAPYRPALTAGPSAMAGLPSSTSSNPASSATPGAALLPAPGLPPAHGAAVIAATPGSGAFGTTIASKYTSAGGYGGLGAGGDGGATGAAGVSGAAPPRPSSSYLPSPAPPAAARMSPAPPTMGPGSTAALGLGGFGVGGQQGAPRYGMPTGPSDSYTTPAPFGALAGASGSGMGQPGTAPQPVAAAGPPSRFFGR